MKRGREKKKEGKERKKRKKGKVRKKKKKAKRRKLNTREWSWTYSTDKCS